jgi:hypothetical protein
VTENPEGQISLVKLNKDLKAIANAEAMTQNEARLLVDSYKIIQDQRLRFGGQIRSMEKEPHALLDWAMGNSETQERWIASALKCYAQSHHMGRWAMAVDGIGPIFAATLLAYIDIPKAPTVGHIWRFAGMDPSQTWASAEEAKAWVKAQGEFGPQLIDKAAKVFGKNAETIRKFATTDPDGKPKKLTPDSLAKAISRRPHNAALKTTLFQIGCSFEKLHNDPESFYGAYYNKQKAYYQAKNEAGDYADTAKKILEEAPSHAQKAIYKTGKLPPGQIRMRTIRWVAKLFISHWHGEAYRHHFKKEPPLPYPIEFMGHAHLIEGPEAA